MLAEFLKAGVQIPDVRRASRDSLAVELKHEAERGVRGGMLGAEVQRPAIATLHQLPSRLAQ
jgi:hypothetical protein